VDFGVKYLTVYAFSTENWTRPDSEVQGILRILGENIERETPELHREGVQIRHLGHMDGVPPSLQEAIRRSTAVTKDNHRLVLSVCFNYGGRDDVVRAVRQMVASGMKPEEVTEEAISRHLFTADIPDPDLIVRTAGEMRLSNFLIWQAAYAEFYSTPTCWPDFDREALHAALIEYSRRQRKFGGILPEERGEYAERDATSLNGGGSQQSAASDVPGTPAEPDPAAVK
jgi:undecaprenyl diphosphate synthase